jgi:hypothetical protein
MLCLRLLRLSPILVIDTITRHVRNRRRVVAVRSYRVRRKELMAICALAILIAVIIQIFGPGGPR